MDTSLSPRGLFVAGVCFVLVPLILQFFKTVIAPLFPRRRWLPLSGLPILNLKDQDFAIAKREYFANLDHYLEYGRDHHRHTGYQIWTPEGYVVILPEELTDEVKLAKDSIIDSSPLSRSITGDVNWMDLRNPHWLNALRNNLISKLAPLTPSITSRVADGVKESLPPTDNWTPTNGWEMLRRIVAHASSRTFVGEELGRDPEWQQMANGYTATVSSLSRSIRQKSFLGMRWALVFRISPEYREWQRFRSRMLKKLIPILEARQAAMSEPNYKKPNDMIQWILDEVQASKGSLTLKNQAEQQLHAIFVSLGTTASAAMSALYDLLSQPQYIEPLRQEIDSVLESSKDHIDATSLAQMTKLDSFLKESQRLNGALTLIGFREVRAANGLTFSNGLHLPKGTVFAVPAYLVSRDPKNWSQPGDFQGFRFSELRGSDPDNSKRFFLTSTGPTQLGFGYGRHSCPGRFFAALELKTMFANFLRNYEFQPLKERPRGPMFAGNALAKKDVDIFYKSRVRI